MILPLAILLLTTYYTIAYGILRYAVLDTLKRRVTSAVYREFVLITVALITPWVILKAIMESFQYRLARA
jgi:hypothetical protein